MMDQSTQATRKASSDDPWAIRRHVIAGVALICLLFGVIGGWAVASDIAGAVVAAGQVVVESNTKKVQHREGGVVAALLVREGDRVAAGQILLRMDDTLPRANLEVIRNQIIELTARRLRLEAMRDRMAEIALPDGFSVPGDRPKFDVALHAEQILLAAQRDLRAQKQKQLREQVAQIRQEMKGLTAQSASRDAQLQLISQELVGVQQLATKKLVPLTRVMALERDAERLNGEGGELTASIAQSRNKIAEIEMQMTQIDADMLAETLSELRDVSAKLSELAERHVAAEDQLRHIDVLAPRAGFVQELAVHTIGGVVNPGETMMLIVPEEDRLIVEARIDPQHIDQVGLGREAFVRFSSFSQKTTPELVGKIYSLSADATVDQKTGASFYLARLQFDRDALPADLRDRLVPGMPAEVYVQTGQRSVLSYFLKPLTDQLARTFREE
ncbi:HlyD family type I secretion periplasmic adaptor subunit [Ferrovibrio sp.]|uniref:HlyD family type I secretion periplasmic adaptor subunit n=1 Tax=Ferrovibrio sp. TaxID=1917215 RepID=UPI0035AE3A5C